MVRKNSKIPFWVIAVGDALLANAAILLVYLIRFHGVLPAINVQPFYKLSPLIAAFTIVFLGFLDLYKRDWNGINRNIPTIAVALFVVFLATNTATFWIRGFAFPRSVLFFGFILQIVLIWLWRSLLWWLESSFQGTLDVVLIGSSTDEEVFEKIAASANGFYRIKMKAPVESIDISSSDFKQADVFFILPSVNEKTKMSLMNYCLTNGKTFFLVPRLYDIIVSNAELKQIDDLPVIEINPLGSSAGYAVVKRLIDIAVSGVGLIILAPLMALIAVAVKITSPGPVFYVQERIGQREKPFLLYKFRTMVDNAEAKTGPVLAASDDPRITPVGKFLRRTRLDELPQLWNVLRGDMSFVGPRPERPFFVEQFKRKIPAYTYRHFVKPGITGLAQIAGSYTTNPNDKLRYDLFYIRNLSLYRDFKIILKTIPVVFNKEAAEGCRGSSPLRPGAG